MTKELAQKACDWIMEDRYPALAGAAHIPSIVHESAVPVNVVIGNHSKAKKTWFGALYCVAEPLQAGYRAVTEKQAKAGDIERSYRLYLIGKRFQTARDKWVVTYDLPADRRKPLEPYYDPEDEWYTACYWDGDTAGLSPETIKTCHPFGPSFILTLHHIMNFSSYKGQKIDHFERKPYARYPMTVEYL